MKFSVLMSVYAKDNPDFFKVALESVTENQTIKPDQVVVVEDGPVSEEIEKIIESLHKNNSEIEFTVVRKEKNAGLAAALNSGLIVCRNDWVARMDSDDISLPYRFQKQLEFITKNTDVSIVGGAISEFVDDPSEMESKRCVGLTQNDILKMAKSRTPFNHVSVLYKKSVVLKAGGYSENFGKLEDYKLWVDMLSHGAIGANINDVIVNVRVGNGFIERRSNKREITDWDMLQKYLLQSGMINKIESFANKVYIRVFIYMPGWMKKIAYKVVLRK